MTLEQLEAQALKYPGRTFRESPYLAVSGTIPPHKDHNEPPYLALLILEGGGILGQEVGYSGPLVEGDEVVVYLHGLHWMKVWEGEALVASYGNGLTAENALKALSINIKLKGKQ